MNSDLDSILDSRPSMAHITISNSLTDEQWQAYVTGVNNFLRLADEPKPRGLPKLVLLRLKELLEIYAIYREYAFAIAGDATVKGKFHKAFTDIFYTPDSSKIVGTNEIAKFRHELMVAAQKSDRIQNMIDGSKKEEK